MQTLSFVLEGVCEDDIGHYSHFVLTNRNKKHFQRESYVSCDASPEMFPIFWDANFSALVRANWEFPWHG